MQHSHQVNLSHRSMSLLIISYYYYEYVFLSLHIKRVHPSFPTQSLRQSSSNCSFYPDSFLFDTKYLIYVLIKWLNFFYCFLIRSINSICHSFENWHLCVMRTNLFVSAHPLIATLQSNVLAVTFGLHPDRKSQSLSIGRLNFVRSQGRNQKQTAQQVAD